jgi:hypothetical protein
MTGRTGISGKFVLTIGVIFSSLILLLALAFYRLAGTSLAFMRDSMIRESALLREEKARLATERLIMAPRRNVTGLSEGICSHASGDPDFLHAIIFSKTSDDDYFSVSEIVPLAGAFEIPLAKGAVVREDREVNFLKKGLFGHVTDPEIRKTGGICWQSCYFPVAVGRKNYVIQYMMSAAKTMIRIEEYASEIHRVRTWVFTIAGVMITAVCAACVLFLYNFRLLLSGLSSSMKKAAGGDLDVNLKPGADAEFDELAHSFNSLIGEIKEKERIIQELENKESFSDLFKFGVNLLKEGRTDDAILFYRALIILKPEGFGSYFNLGVAYAKKRDFRSSISMFEKALEIKPGDERTLENITRVRNSPYFNESEQRGSAT